MLQPATPSGTPTRRRAHKLLGLALILVAFALALPAGASAFRFGGGAMAAATGNVTGRVTDAGGAGIGDIDVNAYLSDGSGGWDNVKTALTAADGACSLGGVPAGNCRIEFFDFYGAGYVAQFYNNKSTVEEADDVAVTVGATTSGIDATLISAAPTVTLKLNGLKSGAVRLGKSVTASGKVTPTSPAGGKVTLTVQMKKGSAWVKAKTASATITSTGAYSWKHKPTKKGAYRVQAKTAKTAAHAAATSEWLTFTVK
ncbi:MAG: carboxypeptidase-like regulatory domain-containing protein [Actinomycetes bacterium]